MKKTVYAWPEIQRSYCFEAIDSSFLFHDGYLRIGNGILTTKSELSTAAGEVRSAIDATHHPKVIRE